MAGAAGADESPLANLQFKTDPVPYRMSAVDVDSSIGAPKYHVTFITSAGLLSMVRAGVRHSGGKAGFDTVAGLLSSPDLKARLSEDQLRLMRGRRRTWPGWFMDRPLGPKPGEVAGAERQRLGAVPWELFPRLEEWAPGEPDEATADVWAAGLRVYHFEAASEQDARLVLEGILERANTAAREEVSKMAARLTAVRAEVAQAEAELTDAEARVSRATAKLEEMQSHLGYADGQLAKDELADVFRALRRLAVDMAGVTARGGAVDKLLAGDATNPALVAMRTELDVEMAGLLGRQATLQSQRDELQTYANVPDELNAARDAKCSARDRLERPHEMNVLPLKDRPAQLEALLENPPLSMQPVKLLDDTVVLRPVEVIPAESRPADE